VLAGYAVMAGAVSAWRYVVLINVVDEAFAENGKVGAGDRVARIRDAVLRGASQADVPLLPDEVSVSEDGNVVTVRIRHLYSVVEYQARRLEIPISIERALAFP
jgi:hypothetical protein